jgi:hypothetical protein
MLNSDGSKIIHGDVMKKSVRTEQESIYCTKNRFTVPESIWRGDWTRIFKIGARVKSGLCAKIGAKRQLRPAHSIKKKEKKNGSQPS